jgi:hypothetical protein
MVHPLIKVLIGVMIVCTVVAVVGVILRSGGLLR